MRIEINVSPDIKEPYAVINTNCVTAEISGIAEALGKVGNSAPIIGYIKDRMVILDAKEISLIRVENEKVYASCKKEVYSVNKRMYELLEILGPDFMQVSKSACINLKFLESVEPSFNGVMLLYLKDGEKEYISRKFVPKLKEYLGL